MALGIGLFDQPAHRVEDVWQRTARSDYFKQMLLSSEENLRTLLIVDVGLHVGPLCSGRRDAR